MDERIEREASREEAAVLWMAISLLLGLTQPKESLKALLQGVGHMKESAMYQLILEEGLVKGREEGRIEEARKLLRRLGERRLGPMTPEIRVRIEAISDVDRLDELIDRVLEVSSWEELLGTD
jgi:predicted transposase YdaD